MRVHVCVFTRARTHTLHTVYSSESRDREDTLGEPEEFKETRCQDTQICVCVRSAHVYIYAGRSAPIKHTR